MRLRRGSLEGDAADGERGVLELRIVHDERGLLHGELGRLIGIRMLLLGYSKGARITDAYFEKQSTTDYNGVYKGRYIDFEAKNTKSTTSFPLSNISEHQIIHLKNVLKHGGIAFFIISFQMKDEIYLLDASFVIDFYEHGKRKSIPYEVFTKEGILIKQDYSPRLHYLDAVEALYFK